MYRKNLIEAMEDIFEDMPDMVFHTHMVKKYAEKIADKEQVDSCDKKIIIASAILHDIGMVEAYEKYGSYSNRYQELEGPIIAERILEGGDFTEDEVERILYIIGHHHSPSKVNGIDFQILWEADMLSDIEDMNIENPEKMKQFIDENFKTESGKKLAYKKYLKRE